MSRVFQRVGRTGKLYVGGFPHGPRLTDVENLRMGTGCDLRDIFPTIDKNTTGPLPKFPETQKLVRLHPGIGSENLRPLYAS